MKPKGAKFCTQAPALRVEVTEKPDVPKEEREYGFNITVYTQCFDNKEKLIVEYVEDGKGFSHCMYLQLFFNNIFSSSYTCTTKIPKNAIPETLSMNLTWQLTKNGYDFKHPKIIIFLI